MDDETFEEMTGVPAIPSDEAENVKGWIIDRLAEFPSARRAAFIEDLSPKHRQMLYSFGMPTDFGDPAALEAWLTA